MIPVRVYTSDTSCLGPMCYGAGLSDSTCTVQAQQRREIRLKDFT